MTNQKPIELKVGEAYVISGCIAILSSVSQEIDYFYRPPFQNRIRLEFGDITAVFTVVEKAEKTDEVCAT